MVPSGKRDHVLVLDFSGRFAARADEMLRDSGYLVLRPRSGAEALEQFAGCRDQVAFVLSAGDHEALARALQSVQTEIRVFLFDRPARKCWLSSLGTFP